MNGSASLTGKILIADDNRVNRLLLGRGLEHKGHTVAFAEHGREALELLRRHDFDLLLLDVIMPELDGYLVLEEVQRDPHLRDTPVIVTSALDELDSVVRCLEMGAEDYLDQAGQRRIAQRAHQRDPREEAPTRPATRVHQHVRGQGSGG